MKIHSLSYPRRAVVGLIAALVIGFAVVATCNTVWAATRGVSVLRLWDDASPFQILIAGSPYAVLAVFGISARRPWLVGLCLTAAFWGYYLWKITTFDGIGGANIGLGILMMFSPILIIAGSLFALVTLANGRGADDMANGR
ncbi:hypothetical protein QP166_11080 [Sphingomonas sp. LR60]|uniref:hypothetical protein n=1 Tax=Sphingomonas sp. LR60 TaxID=3050233 RepID=UPI002FE214EC